MKTYYVTKRAKRYTQMLEIDYENIVAEGLTFEQAINYGKDKPGEYYVYPEQDNPNP